jgi:hypothetical protein
MIATTIDDSFGIPIGAPVRTLVAYVWDITELIEVYSPSIRGTDRELRSRRT